ncbi:30S ribosomal protein S4e [Salinarchaeum sp. Harcht-Bsk1]|uniref:30S ribosomal protein S4e n=1 Tax=Salinarchaeum sp. Harcht-Bsk1 TaxID=1333523 RepID=UPI0003422E3E|nr:30S ribosomal protein S4e [Salinarchaeum sp. Harcht-Bsk1]AGN02178.1 30S ribosomal protein S4e [Salinarchaeum sp. Harcht-Bsk1]
MSNHQKRLSVPKSWPVERKTETFTVKADAGPHGEDGVPLVVLLRDVLGYVDSRKEARYALDAGSVRVNGDRVSDEGRPIGMFDILAFLEREEYYRVFPDEGGRLALSEIDEEAAGSKLGKVVGKRDIAGGDVQLTLHDGETLVVEAGADYAPKDSLVVDNEDGEIVAHFPYEEGELVTAVRGQHAGQIGELETIDVAAGSSPNRVVVDALDGETFETVEEYVVVIDENFVSDEDASDETDEADEATGDSDADADDESAEDEGGDDE